VSQLVRRPRGKDTKVRFGTFYRCLVSELLGVHATGKSVLDVGSFDGFFLSTIEAPLKVGIDPSPAERRFSAVLVADVHSLPFPEGCFDTVFAFDVIEHIPDDAGAVQSMLDALAKRGTLWMSVPFKDFTITPPFLTGWYNRRCGHVRPGYSATDIHCLFPQECEITKYCWNEPFFRRLYFPLRALWAMVPALARRLLRVVLILDSRFADGKSGHLFIKVRYVK